MLKFQPMQRKGRRTIIDLSRQPGLDFEDDTYRAEFTLPEYQRGLLLPRTYALLTDLLIVFGLYLIFVIASMSEMPGSMPWNRRVLGIYGAAYLLLLVVYFFLFMLSTSQTTGMRLQGLIATNTRGERLYPAEALLRGFGYVVSVIPLLFGFLWAFLDPEHLTWADKVSGTFIRRV
jgi:uncharacterized RDD family membrane protein YckC